MEAKDDLRGFNHDTNFRCSRMSIMGLIHILRIRIDIYHVFSVKYETNPLVIALFIAGHNYVGWRSTMILGKLLIVAGTLLFTRTDKYEQK